MARKKSRRQRWVEAQMKRRIRGGTPPDESQAIFVDIQNEANRRF